MASDKIKGLTVKIGADTSDFIKSLKGVDREINQTQRLANELQKGLELEFDDKRFIEAQKQVQRALQETEEKADAIRKQLKYLEDTGGVDTEGYQKLQTELAKSENNALKLQEQLKQIDKIKFDSATKGIVKLSNDLETAAKKTAALSLAAGGALAGMVKLAKDAVKVGDDIQTTADKFDLSAEAIQRWSYIAMQSDVAGEQLYKGMAKVRVAIGTALTGESNNASKAIEKLVGDVSLLPSDAEKAFETVVIALSEVEDKTLQAYYANSIFGEEMATNLIPLLNQGADGIKQFSQEFEQVGYLSDEQVANLSKFDNQLNMVNQQFQNAKTELGIALLPVLETFSKILSENIVPAIQKLSEWLDNLSEGTKKFIVTALLLVAGLSPVLMIVSKIVGLIPTLINGFNMLSAHPIIAIIGVVASLLMYLYTTNEEFAQSVNKLLKILGRGLSAVFKPIANLLNTIFQLLSPIIDLLVNILCPVLELVSTLLEPIVWLLEKISDLINGVGNFILTLFGKGWLWGTDNTTNNANSSITSPSISEPSFNIPNTSNNNYSNNYYDDTYNLDITLNTTGNLEYDSKSLADEVIRQIVVKKQAGGR